MGHEMVAKRTGFDAAIAFGRTLPDVEVTTTWGAPALKVRGKMFACVAINKSAEPDSMVVRMDMTQRDLLIEDDPATYYVTDHYVDYPCVLVRLSRVSPESLRDLIRGAHRFISATTTSARSLSRADRRTTKKR
ncbi:MAG TPA: MmcQ/YjbR family DNA-binding protein [Vicinamibacterales bacterium]|nr:MmcQ/YjbR family DNA-binding protein [Vicinamibacterales bacterium]